MARHRLTEIAIQKAIKKDEERRGVKRLADGDNLYLAILPSGVTTWQLRYRHAGKQKTASLGKYPRVGIQQARTRAEETRKVVESGLDAVTHKRVQRLRKQAE